MDNLVTANQDEGDSPWDSDISIVDNHVIVADTHFAGADAASRDEMHDSSSIVKIPVVHRTSFKSSSEAGFHETADKEVNSSY